MTVQDGFYSRGQRWYTVWSPISKLLLPGAKFCDSLGITKEEYFEYYELVAQHEQKEQGRELIPDVRNEAVTIAYLVIGVALSAVGMLLAPKPRAPQQKEQGNPFQSQDNRGRTKYAPLAEFDSVRLATLGSIVPLIYTKRENGHGGVRASPSCCGQRCGTSPFIKRCGAMLLALVS